MGTVPASELPRIFRRVTLAIRVLIIQSSDCRKPAPVHLVLGFMALPLLSRLYVRQIDISKLKQQHQWEFRTKHQISLELLCRDAMLFDVPKNIPGQRGRPRKYGKHRISLAKRAERRDGWQSITYCCRGLKTEGRYETFIATSRVVGGQCRVVLLEHGSGNWAAYISTDPTMSVEAILQTVSDRWSIEEHFHDVKEIWGAGEQQVRNVRSNIACWNLCGWMYSLVRRLFGPWSVDPCQDSPIHSNNNIDIPFPTGFRYFECRLPKPFSVFRFERQ